VLVIPTIAEDAQLGTLARTLNAPSHKVAQVSGLWGSSALLVCALAANQSPSPMVYVTAHLDAADGAREDLELFLGRTCKFFPAWETLPGEGPASGEINAERLALCSSLHQANKRLVGRKNIRSPIVVAPIQALMQPVPTLAKLADSTLTLSSKKKNEAPSPEALLEWAIDHGFERLELVESPGDVARRGDIVDIFSPGDTHPVRIEYFGDELESIRKFDVCTQRSYEVMKSYAVCGVYTPDPHEAESQTSLLTYLPKDTLFVLDDPTDIQEMGQTLKERLGEAGQLFPVTDILADLSARPQLHLTRFQSGQPDGKTNFSFHVKSLTRFESDAAQAVAELCRLSHDNCIHVVCDNDGERSRLQEMIFEILGTKASQINLHIGVMQKGFDWSATNTIVVGHHELFHRHRQRRRIRKDRHVATLESWTELSKGDHVVHVVHGIAIYQGLTKLQRNKEGCHEEFLTLEFADKAIVHVPTSQVDLVQKYIGVAGRRPTLSKLGGRRWQKMKDQAADSVADMAESLLRVQAARADSTGIAYPADTTWQREFEAAFPYEETEDQLSVAVEIRDDLVRHRPMDRLLCGDVGYGKTELAMRAAFKVIEYGKQVAVLVPTTVLAEQHFKTFKERFADYPFAIECLSRFRSGEQQKQIVERIKRGQVDLVVGTHRLVSKDIAFKDLGLIVIDEEQRFGVAHKERLKTLRHTVDILTLTATPIPRTLHMSMMGLRDISSLQTPPVDRRAIATEVRAFERTLIHDAIVREMNRDGQIYFVHNFVRSIATMAETIASIVPEARVVFGHGQMKTGELEEVMHKFVRREADVLVATTIIESGIDIPTANTIFINRADRIGLADLHQLRGRVGRSDHLAYCYLLIPSDRPPTVKAVKRLKTIEEFSELGAGFRIAMRDLEIRGAGNILGGEQSGHIAAVGYDMYCRLLERAVRKMKNEPDPMPPPLHIDLEIDAHIPPRYAQAERSRIEIYRRIVGCTTLVDLEQIEKDLIDAFGPIPQPVSRLIQLAEVRVLGRRFGIKSISLHRPDIVFRVEQAARAEPVFIDAPGTVRMADGQTIHVRPPPNYLEDQDTLLAILRRMLSRDVDRIGVQHEIA